MGLISYAPNDWQLEQVPVSKVSTNNAGNPPNSKKNSKVILNTDVAMIVYTFNSHTFQSLELTHDQNVILNTKELEKSPAKSINFNHKNSNGNLIIESINVSAISKSLNHSNTQTWVNKKYQYGPKSTPYSIIETNEINNELNKEGNSMEQLIEHRQHVEKVGIITGVALGLTSMIIPFFTGMNFSLILPSTIMFLSLSGFMLLRKRIRRHFNG